jgi:hypothetical protein
MYRTFGCTGGSANDILMAAFIAAYDSGGRYFHIILSYS